MEALNPPTLGVVLAGGLARRMGGGDKPLRLLGDRPLLDHVLDRLRPQVQALAINAAGDPARFAAWNLPVIADSIPDYAGPLAGVLAGMDWAAATHPAIDWLVTAPGDSPFLPADLVARLHDAKAQVTMPLAYASSGGREHPPVALWSISLRENLRAALIGGERKVRRWMEMQGCATADWPSQPVDPFFNANTPSDLIEAEALLPLAP